MVFPMRCGYPISVGTRTFGCGRCMGCRLNRQRDWATRIWLEASLHEVNSFVTLTYDEANIPLVRTICGGFVGTVSKADWRSFSKGIGYRYFGVAEYGSRSMRPHYHAVLFGCDPFTCESLVRTRWTKGHSSVRFLSDSKQMRYVAHYTLKKYRNTFKPEDGDPRLPEFARMSLKPGIGYGALPRLARWYSTPMGRSWLEANFDVVRQLRIEGKIVPLPDYMVEKLRELVGLPKSDPRRTELQDSRRLMREIALLERDGDTSIEFGRELAARQRYESMKSRSHGVI